MALWMAPPSEDDDAIAAFRECYTDPVVVNGTPLSVADLVARMRMLHRAFADLRHEPLEEVDAGDHLVIAFRMLGTHVGPYQSALGEIAPTGKPIAVRTIDVLTIEEDRISAIWVVADELGLLTDLGAVRLG